jgi:hypothetical protein
MLPANALSGIPEETANRLMMAHGSGMLLRALRGDPEPPLPPLETRLRDRTGRLRRVYVPVDQRALPPAPEHVRNLIASIAEAFGLTADDLTGKRRLPRIVHARALAIRLIRERTWADGTPRHTVERIGNFLGREHTTISYALENFERYCEQSPDMRAVYERLRGAE